MEVDGTEGPTIGRDGLDTEEKEAGEGYERRCHPRPDNELLGTAAGDGEAERMENGVEPVNTDGNEDEGRCARRQILNEPHEATHERSEDPAAGNRLTEDEGHRKECQDDVDAGQRHDEVVRGRLEPSTSVDNEAGEDVADHRWEPENNEDNGLNNGCWRYGRSRISGHRGVRPSASTGGPVERRVVICTGMC